MSNRRRWTRQERIFLHTIVKGYSQETVEKKAPPFEEDICRWFCSAGDTPVVESVDELLPDLPHPLFSKSGNGLATGGVGDSGCRESILSDVIR